MVPFRPRHLERTCFLTDNDWPPFPIVVNRRWVEIAAAGRSRRIATRMRRNEQMLARGPYDTALLVAAYSDQGFGKQINVMQGTLWYVLSNAAIDSTAVLPLVRGSSDGQVPL